MEEIGLPLVAKAVLVFSAGFFKIRWETLYQCLHQLDIIRSIRTHMCKEVFGDCQEREMLKDFLILCKDDALWAFIRAAAPFAQHCEYGRKWGLVCKCHEAELMKGVVVNCDEKSRRLPEVWDFVCRWCATSHKRARELRMTTLAKVPASSRF